MHQTTEPAIHYWGTPVVPVSSLNEDGSINVSSMSSAWWLGWSCMLGLDASSKTVENLGRSKACVLNLPSDAMADSVNRLALTTGSRNVPVHKKLLGYRHEPDKFAASGLTPSANGSNAPLAVRECAVQLDGVVVWIQSFAAADPRMAVPAVAVEVRIVGVRDEEEPVRAPPARRLQGRTGRLHQPHSRPAGRVRPGFRQRACGARGGADRHASKMPATI